MGNTDILPVYILVGGAYTGYDKIKEERTLQLLKRRLSEGGDIDLNTDVFEGKEMEGPEDIIAACETLPFCSDYRLIILRDVKEAKETVLDAMLAYLKAPSPSTVLILTIEKPEKSGKAKKSGKPKKLEELMNCAEGVGKNAIIDCAKKTRKDTPAFFSKTAKVNFNISLRESESAYLISKVGSDPVAVEAELRKLSLYVNAMGKREVTKKDIDKVVTKSIVTKPWELADALSERNMALTLTLYSEMENDSPFAILAMCVTRMRELIAAKAMAAREPSERESLSKLFEGRDWQYENHGRWARNYTGDELVDALRRGVELEVAIKTGSTPREGREGLFAWLVDTIRA